MGDACMDAGGRATQDAQAEGKGWGEKFNNLFPHLLNPLPPWEGTLIFSMVLYAEYALRL